MVDQFGTLNHNPLGDRDAGALCRISGERAVSQLKFEGKKFVSAGWERRGKDVASASNGRGGGG